MVIKQLALSEDHLYCVNEWDKVMSNLTLKDSKSGTLVFNALFRHSRM